MMSIDATFVVLAVPIASALLLAATAIWYVGRHDLDTLKRTFALLPPVGEGGRPGSAREELRPEQQRPESVARGPSPGPEAGRPGPIRNGPRPAAIRRELAETLD